MDEKDRDEGEAVPYQLPKTSGFMETPSPMKAKATKEVKSAANAEL